MEATMLDSQWYLGVLLAGVAAHLVVLYGTYRRQQAAATTDADAATVENGVIDCPECGTANDADYRYCGGCATQLPHAGALNQQDTGPRGSLFG
ncbi:hypothetical protein [Halonotius sp. F2-221B]|uniref:DUF7577 domain-containing protein n=1 Tax=Halonotius sp. F2-221B TaxID=2731620 RepID=UPI00398B391D